MRRAHGEPRRGPVARGGIAGGVAAWLALAAGPALARQAEPAPEPPDTAVFALDAVVVTADRGATRVATATAAVSVLSRAELDRLPARSVASALERAPGFAILDFDGGGLDPQPVLRGFYGGGEAEYVQLLVDGVPVNGFRDGRIDWDLIPLAAIRSVEVVRGGASALWGDAALAGVVHARTASPSASRHLRLSAGQLGTVDASGVAAARVAGRNASGWARFRRTDGFRDGAAHEVGGAGASVPLVSGGDRSVTLVTLHHWRRAAQPGPLTPEALDGPPSAVLPFFRFDGTEDRVHRAGLSARAGSDTGPVASGYLVGEFGAGAIVRTLPLAPSFADTRERTFRSQRLLASVQIDAPAPAPAGAGRVTAGLDATAGRLSSRYYDVLSGGPDVYADAAAARGDLSASGAGTRHSAAAFAHYELRPRDAVRLGAGARIDWLRDRFVPRTGEAAAHGTSRSAFSPKLGVNVRHLDRDRARGHVYASVGRSFKAATFDQLFDQRPIPVPHPPYSITVSNPLLQPQRATDLEAGSYHGFALVPGRWTGDLVVSAYRLDLTDQLDFDLERFRYINLGRSRHTGLESALTVRGPGGIHLFANQTVQRARDRTGEYAGRQLKAVPRRHLSAGAGIGRPSGATVTVTAIRASGIHLDDANQIPLDAFSRVDARLRVPLSRLRLSVDVHNVLDRGYTPTGYPDPAGSGLVYLFPAAGRLIHVAIETEW